MARVYPIEEARRSARPAKRATYFSRTELNQLLSLYSRRVSSGEWRDYAIDHGAGMAVFSVFRHSHDRPAFSIAKHGAGRAGEFLVFAGTARLKRADSIAEAVEVLERKPRLVLAQS